MGCLSLMAMGCSVGDVSDAEAIDSSAQAVLYAPPAPSSGNVLDSTDYLGALPVNGAVSASFNKSPEYFSWSVDSPAGANVRLEVTHLGSSMYLDTGLFLYGPRAADGSYGTTVVAQDDDAGYGQLSKIDWLTIQSGGEYLAVVSSANGIGKKARLALTCLNGQCDPVEQLTLDPYAVSSSLSQQVAAADQSSYDDHVILDAYAFDWPYVSDTPLDLAVEAVMGIQDIAYYGFYDYGEITLSDLEQQLRPAFDPIVPSILSEFGDGSETVRIEHLYTSYPVAPGADAWHDAFVILFPQSHRIALFQQIEYET